ncbi:hypothetical protein [Actinoallomurus soli]|uniref:hypothetical protein n=1 Tax=Actinoallomurus soli TaxID=2952535 RepID=UPI0020938DDC|nr:hypothetical protein [Actinoallomurus soli]MCO5974429.1 hypothetical protein [Actinoallomurus soli]
MDENKTARWAAALAIGAAAATALTGCGLSEGVKEKTNGHIKTVSYTTATAGKSDRQTQLPSWVPDQARSVSETIRTTGSERILRFTLDDPKALTACHRAAPSHTPATLTASWWPSGQESKTNTLCATDWHVLEQGTTVYAYRPEIHPQRHN